jgi:hypothetical protein
MKQLGGVITLIAIHLFTDLKGFHQRPTVQWIAVRLGLLLPSDVSRPEHVHVQRSHSPAVFSIITCATSSVLVPTPYLVALVCPRGLCSMVNDLLCLCVCCALAFHSLQLFAVLSGTYMAMLGFVTVLAARTALPL